MYLCHILTQVSPVPHVSTIDSRLYKGMDMGTHLGCAIMVCTGKTPPPLVYLHHILMQVSPVPHMSTVCSHLYKGTEMATHLGHAITTSTVEIIPVKHVHVRQNGIILLCK